MSRFSLVAAALGASLSLPACTSFVPGTLVESLRILAIRGEPAEVGSDMQATLRSLVVNPTLDQDAGAAPIEYEWALCTKMPANGVAVDPDCYDADAADFITELPSQADGTTMLTMPNYVLSDFGLPDASGGFYVPVRLRVSQGGQQDVAFHLLRWRAGFVPPNNNPTLTGIEYIPTGTDGELPDMGEVVDAQPLPDDTMAPMQLPRGGKLRLRATDAPGSAEQYMTFVGDPSDPSNITFTTDTEEIQFFWYTTAGNIGIDVTGEARPDTTLDTAKYDDTLDTRDGLVDLWLVAREERGGVDFLHRQLLIK